MPTFYEGGIDTFNAIAYGDPHPNTVNFIEQMVSQPTQALSSATQHFMDSAYDAYERLMGSEAMRTMYAAGRQLASQWDRDIIRPLTTIGDLQQAPNVMKRYLMAEEHARHLYHQQRCDGYSDSYIDIEPGCVGEDHYDYRRVMDGVVVETEDGQWSATSYFDDIYEGDRALIPEEQFDILASWERLRLAIVEGKDDPTSRWNAEL